MSYCNEWNGCGNELDSDEKNRNLLNKILFRKLQNLLVFYADCKLFCSKIERSYKKWNYTKFIQTALRIKNKNSKRTSKCKFTVLENQKTRKNWPSGALGPASASPWRAKRGTLPKLLTFLSRMKGDSLEKKKSKKSLTMPKNWKGIPFGIFKHPNCCKISSWRGTLWGKKFEKKSQCRKKTERGSL